MASPLFDEDGFPAFGPLLAACETYARQSGCRFSPGDFYGILDSVLLPADVGRAVPVATGVVGSSTVGGEQSLIAKLRAAPALAEFALRLRSDDDRLLAELDQAHRLIAAESVRSAMVATFQELELWPPPPQFARKEADECAFLDLAAPLPVLAQRAYDMRSVARRSQKRVSTALFLAEFALNAGARVPRPPNAEQQLLQEFQVRVAEWQERALGAVPRTVSQPAAVSWLVGAPSLTAF